MFKGVVNNRRHRQIRKHDRI